MIKMMSWQKLYVWSKKTHNVTMWGALALGIPQIVTGVILTWFAGSTTSAAALTVHAAVAPYFAVFLILQFVSGLGMWSAPKMLAKTRRESEAKDQTIG